MPLHPNNLIIKTTKAKPTIATVLFSPLKIVKLIQLLLPSLLPVASMTNPAIIIAPTCLVIPVPHVFAINAVSAKILAQLNGLSAKCKNLATGTQMAKDYNALHKATISSKPCVPPAPSGC